MVHADDGSAERSIGACIRWEAPLLFCLRFAYHHVADMAFAAMACGSLDRNGRFSPRIFLNGASSVWSLHGDPRSWTQRQAVDARRATYLFLNVFSASCSQYHLRELSLSRKSNHTCSHLLSIVGGKQIRDERIRILCGSPLHGRVSIEVSTRLKLGKFDDRFSECPRGKSGTL